MDTNELIVQSLNLSPSKQTMGCLLRNWDEIAGRDKSPEKFLGSPEKSSSSCDKFKENDQATKKLDCTVTTENSSSDCDNSVLEKEIRQCLSPDLFDDDDDDDLEYTESFNTTPKASGKNYQVEKLPSASKSQPVSEIPHSLSTAEDSVEASSKSLTKMFKSLSQSSVMAGTSTTEEFKASFIDAFNPAEEINKTAKHVSSESETIFKKRSPKHSKVVSSETTSSISSKSPSKYRPVSPCISFKSQTKISSSQYSPTKVETMSVNSQSPTRSKEKSTETSIYSTSSISSRFHTEIIPPSSSIIDLSQGSSSNDSFKMITEITNLCNKPKTQKFESETFGSYSGTSSRTNSFATIEKDSNGIEYFESFYDPAEECVGMRNSFVDLISSDEDDRLNKTTGKHKKITENFNC